jgi:DNA end-binding protein Ku
VPSDELVKAYEYDDGKLVYLTDEDFKAAEEEGYRTIEILDFVPHEEIDPIVFRRTFYLGPDRGADKVYALLVKAMERSDLSGIARYVFHDKQQIGCLRVRDGVITLESMYFADEIRPSKGIAPKGVRVSARELALAESLIDRVTSHFDHSRYKDEYQRRLRKVVERKRKGEEVHAAAPTKREHPPDLFEALRASVEAAKRRQNGRAKSRSVRGRAKRTAARR